MSDQDKFIDAWRILSAADQTLHSRIASMLVAEAFLIAGYAASQSDAYLQSLIILFGFVVTLVFLVTNWRVGQKIEALLKKDYVHNNPVWKDYSNASWLPEFLQLETALPFLFLLFWGAVFFHPFGVPH